MSKLPEGWKKSKLGEFLTLRNGYAFKSQDFESDGIPVIRISDIQDGIVKPDEAVRIPSAKSKNGFFLEKGDVLVAMSGATTGKIGRYVSDQPALQNQRVGNLVPKDKGISKDFVYYLIQNHKKDIEEQAYGGAQPNISSKLIESIETNLPPLPEQKRIVAKLDTLFAHLDQLRARLDKIPVLLKQFRQAVLTQAVTGKLTEGSLQLVTNPIVIGRPTEQAPKGWRWKKLIDVATLESGHTPRKSVPEYWNNGTVPWICLQDIREAHGKEISRTKYYTTLAGIANSSARILPKGTVCFSRDISVGFVTVMGTEMATTQHFANWICGEELNNYYLMYCFMASRISLIESGKGTTVGTIYMPALKDLYVLIPPVIIQEKIVKKLKHLLSVADILEAAHRSVAKKMNYLPEQTLSKAFRGELVCDESIEYSQQADNLLLAAEA